MLSAFGDYFTVWDLALWGIGIYVACGLLLGAFYLVVVLYYNATEAVTIWRQRKADAKDFPQMEQSMSKEFPSMMNLHIPIPEFRNPAQDTVDSLLRSLDKIGRTLDANHEAGLSIAEDGRRVEISVLSIEAENDSRLLIHGIDADEQRVWFNIDHAQSVIRIVAVRKREELQTRIGF